MTQLCFSYGWPPIDNGLLSEVDLVYPNEHLAADNHLREAAVATEGSILPIRLDEDYTV
jgi:hypothetical protein